MPDSALLQTLVIDSRLGARPLRDYLDDRSTASGLLHGTGGRMRGESEPPELPLVESATLQCGVLYVSAADEAVRFYLPEYRLDVDVEDHATLTWRGPSTDDAPVAELQIRLTFDVPNQDDVNLLLLPAPHQAALWLRYARPVEGGGSPIVEEFELGPLQPAGSFRQRLVRHDLYDQEDFHLLYLAMTQSRWNATLEVRTQASVAMRTVSQMVLGTPDLHTRVEALRQRNLLFSQQARTPMVTDGTSTPGSPRRVDLAAPSTTVSPNLRRSLDAVTRAGSTPTTTPSVADARMAAPVNPGLASRRATTRRTDAPTVLGPSSLRTPVGARSVARTLGRTPTVETPTVDATSLLRGLSSTTRTRPGGLNLDLGGDRGTSTNGGMSVDLGKNTSTGFNVGDRMRGQAAEVTIRSLRIPPGWTVELFTDGALSSAPARLTGDQARLPTAFDTTGALSLAVEAPTGAAGPVLPGMPGVTLFADPRFTGGHQVLTVGRHDVTGLAIGNDVVSSLKVPDGLTATLFEHARFVGAQRSFTQDTAVLIDFDGRTSSVLVEVNRAILFGGPSFGGKCQAFGPGSYDQADIGLDRSLIASLRLPAGWCAVLYSEAGFGGEASAFAADTAGLGELQGKVGSLRVFGPLTPGHASPAGGVSVFTGPNHSGQSATYGPGSYNRAALGVPDNTIRSVRVAEGWRVTLCELDGFSGRATTLTADAGQLVKLDQRVSSLIVELVGVLTYAEPDFGGAMTSVGGGRHDASALRALRPGPTALTRGPAAPDRFEVQLNHAERSAAPDFLTMRSSSRLRIDSLAAVPSRMVSTTSGKPAIAEVVARDRQVVGEFAFIADSEHFRGVPGEFGLTGETLTRHDLFDPDTRAKLATVYHDTLLNRYFYTPNAFRLSRRSTSPFLPDLAVLLHEVFTQDDASGAPVVVEHPRVTLLYQLVPTLSASALAALMELDGRGTLPLLRPIEPSSATLTLTDMPSDNPESPDTITLARPEVVVDLAAGFSDVLELSYHQFERLWSREMLPSGHLLTGTVRLGLSDGSHHDVPIEGSLRQTLGDPFDRTFLGRAQDAPGRCIVALRNRLESPVHLVELRASRLDGGAIATPIGAVPQQIAPGEAFQLTYEISPPEAAVLDIRPDIEVAVVPSYPVLLPLLMGDKGFASDTFEIEVRIQPFWFEFSAGEPITGVRVEFDGDLTIELTAEDVSRQLTLRRNAAAALLGQDTADQYRYRVINLHPSGAGARSAWIESFGDLEVFPATGDVAEPAPP